MSIELETPDKLEYQFHPVTSGSLNFKIKAPNDAHVALTAGPEEADPMYEVFIGGWGNTKSVIRRDRTKPDKAEAETPDILSGDEFRGFWLRWNGGLIEVGKEGEAAPFLSWQDPEPAPVGHYGVCTGWGASGAWVLDAGAPGFSVPSAPPAGSTPTWVDARAGEVPPEAVPGGFDGEQLYVGRAQHEGALIPGKVVPSHGVCYVAWGGAEHGKEEYQVLCGCDVTWVPSAGGEIPSNALPSGETEDGEPLFTGRAQHEGTVTVGKVQASHNVCYIPYGGQELGYPDYEVLVPK
ncbi:Farnesoic acid O-methyltransferase [Gryllus bimaculatus]|nr:Farnesoic acid O-methyltransferase [Gryllus bimaculatus]